MIKQNELRVFYIPKKNGYRKIVTYNNNSYKLREFHQKIGILLYRRVLPSKFAKAYIKKRSIIVNAKSHMYNDIFIMFDIKNFFQSINHNWLIEKLFYEINLNHKKKISMVECAEIVKSCSISNKGLAIGFIPSPFLANIYLKDFDNILYGNLKKLALKNVIYTRYADDLVISYKGDKACKFDDINKIVSDSLTKFGLKLNNNKTKVIDLNKSNHVKVTGINIIKGKNANENTDNYRSLSVGRKRKDDLYKIAIELAGKNLKDRSSYEIQKVKGLFSFIYSVEGNKFEMCYSDNMMAVVHNLGYDKLRDLINSF